MKTSTLIFKYILPAAVMGGLTIFFVTAGAEARHRPTQERSVVQLELPHGRCLVAVVEREGVYIGDTCIPIGQFGSVFDTVYRKEKLDWAFVCGAAESRYGDAVKVYAKLHEALGNRITFETVPVRSGTRWKPVVNLGRWGWLPAPRGALGADRNDDTNGIGMPR